MKNIVVGIDLNEMDEAVLIAACQLAKATKATLQLVHVFPPKSTALDYVVCVPTDPDKRRADMAEEQEQLETLAADLKQDGVSVEAKLRVDSDSLGILAHAEELNADAIVVGTHSRNVIARVLIGGTADKVIRRSMIPVLVVPTMA